MADDRLRAATRGAITELVFDNPPINIYDVATRDQLCEVLTAVIVDPDARVVVFRAAGDHFSAGADLREFGTAPSLFAMRDARWGRDVWGLLRSVPVPMIASMHGNAVGFGFELALQCDYRIAADDCTVALPESRIGMIPAGGATQTLGRVVGTSAALHVILTAERVPAAEALRRGLVDEVVVRADLAARTDALAASVAARPSAAVRAAKSLVWGALDTPLAEGLRHEADLAAVVSA
ncbi:MAG: enoyl-CoA hydratase/isomerase family protein [Acidimicrobiia bacterium]